MTHTRYRYTCCFYLLRQTFNLISLVVATYSFYLHFSALYMHNPSPKVANFNITALNVKVKIKLTISDVSNNEPMLETCIISELESLSTSNCWKNNNKNHNIKSQNSHNIISRRFHWCWFLTLCYIRNKIKGTTCLWIVTVSTPLGVLGNVLRSSIFH